MAGTKTNKALNDLADSLHKIEMAMRSTLNNEESMEILVDALHDCITAMGGIRTLNKLENSL